LNPNDRIIERVVLAATYRERAAAAKRGAPVRDPRRPRLADMSFLSGGSSASPPTTVGDWNAEVEKNLRQLARDKVPNVRIAAYEECNRLMSGDEHTEEKFYAFTKHAEQYVGIFLVDLNMDMHPHDTSNAIASGYLMGKAAGVLGLFLVHPKIAEALELETQGKLIDTLCDCMLECKVAARSSVVVTCLWALRVTWCNLNRDAMTIKLEKVLELAEAFLDASEGAEFNRAYGVQCEALHFYGAALRTHRQHMHDSVARWGITLCRRMFDRNDAVVRRTAYTVLLGAIDVVWPPSVSTVAQLYKDATSTFIPWLAEHSDEEHTADHAHVIQAWEVLVLLLDDGVVRTVSTAGNAGNVRNAGNLKQRRGQVEEQGFEEETVRRRPYGGWGGLCANA